MGPAVALAIGLAHRACFLHCDMPFAVLTPCLPSARQSCNDVLQDRYCPELPCEVALRLAALQMHEYAVTNNISNKVTYKMIE